MEQLRTNKQPETSSMALGCLNFGSKTDKQTSFQLLDYYVENGGNFLDTANNYAFWFDDSRGGASEALLGEWLQERKNREHIILATKVGARPQTAGTGLENVEGLSSKAIHKAVDESLSRLKTDYIDLLYAHIDDREVSFNETMQAFDFLVKSGKVKKIGCSNFTLERLKEANSLADEQGLAKYCCIQQRHSFLSPMLKADFGIQEYVTNELINYVKIQPNFKLLAYSPLLHGFYNKNVPIPEKYDTYENSVRLLRLNKIANELNATPNQIVLAWMIQGSPNITPVIASSTLSQLQENMEATKIRLTEEQLADLA